MLERVRGYFRSVLNRWLALERSQKIRIIAIAAVLVAVLGLTIYMLARPKMIVLISGQDFTAIGQIQTALNEAGIQNRVTDNGTSIEVPQKDSVNAQLALAEKNVPANASAFTYQDALSFSGMGTTESTKRLNFQRAKESDLADALKQLNFVDNANVQLAVPESDNYFIKSDKTASASVWLSLSRSIDKSQAASVARFISRSVEGLSIENIDIIDQDGNSLYSGTDSLIGGSASSEYDIELMRKAEAEAKIRAALAPLYDEIRPTLNLVLNWDKSQEKQIQYTSPLGTDSATGLVSAEINENRSVTNNQQGAEPGLGANDQTTADYQMNTGAASTGSEKSSQADYLHDQIESVTDKGYGEVRSDLSSGSVIVIKYHKYEEDYMTSNNLLNGLTWEAFKEQTQNTSLTVDDSVLQAVRLGAGIDNMTIIGYEVPVFYDTEVTPLKWEQLVMFAILALLILLLAFALIRNTQPDEVTEIEPELSVEDLLVSTQMEEQREAEVDAMEAQAIEFGRESEVKKLIDKFVLDRPEAVAQLLRNWLNNEWE